MNPRDQFIPVSKHELLEALLRVDGLPQTQREQVQKLAGLMDALYHFEYHAHAEELKRIYLPISPEAGNQERPASPQEVERMRTKLVWLLERANFRPVSEDDIAFALNENHVFELPLEIEWERFDGKPLIYSRGRDVDEIQGRFTMRKLPGYLRRGGVGVAVLGGVLLLLGLFLLFFARGGPVEVVASPGVEVVRALGPGDATTFALSEDILETGEYLRWSVLVLDAQGELGPLPRDRSRGEFSDFPHGPRYVAPVTGFHEDFQIVAHWELMDAQGTVRRSGDAVYEVLASYAPPKVGMAMLIVCWALVGLGALGVALGVYNALRFRRMTPEQRARELYGDADTLRPMTVARNRALNVDRFVDLWRKERIAGDMFSRVLLAYKLKDDPFVRLKLFRDIPLADLELIFPNTRPRMKARDRIMLAISIASAAAVIMIKIAGLLAAAVLTFGVGSLVALASAGGLAGRTWAKFRGVVQRYTAALTASLYYKNLDNNLGVVHALVDGVEEQEYKEALLAYVFLLTAPSPLTEEELDRWIEAWLERSFGVAVDFEVADGIRKLREFAVLESKAGADGELRLGVCAPDKALALLDQKWDGLFHYG